jgi:hypothetical protein
MKSKFSYIGIVAIVGTMLFFASCTRDRNTPGRAYMANFDMYYSKAYDYYSPNPNFKNGQTAQAPVAGTISRGDMPYPFTNSVAGSDSAAKLVNPILFAEKRNSTFTVPFATTQQATEKALCSPAVSSLHNHATSQAQGYKLTLTTDNSITLLVSEQYLV